MFHNEKKGPLLASGVSLGLSPTDGDRIDLVVRLTQHYFPEVAAASDMEQTPSAEPPAKRKAPGDARAQGHGSDAERVAEAGVRHAEEPVGETAPPVEVAAGSDMEQTPSAEPPAKRKSGELLSR